MAALASLAILALGALDLDARLRTAMLRVYVHGVDDRLAEEVVSEQDLPRLRHLLADPTFPRRTTWSRSSRTATAGTPWAPSSPSLEAPPRALHIPEEERAALLVPHALGHLARRGSEAARHALLG
jgi:hypothetical protein